MPDDVKIEIECPHGNWFGNCDECRPEYTRYILDRFAAIIKQERTNCAFVTTWLRQRCEENIQLHGTDKWNSDIEELLKLIEK